MLDRLIQKLLPANEKSAQTLRAVEEKFLAAPSPAAASLAPQIMAFSLGLRWSGVLEKEWRTRYQRCALCRVWLPSNGAAHCVDCAPKSP